MISPVVVVFTSFLLDVVIVVECCVVTGSRWIPWSRPLRSPRPSLSPKYPWLFLDLFFYHWSLPTDTNTRTQLFHLPNSICHRCYRTATRKRLKISKLFVFKRREREIEKQNNMYGMKIKCLNGSETWNDDTTEQCLLSFAYFIFLLFFHLFFPSSSWCCCCLCSVVAGCADSVGILSHSVVVLGLGASTFCFSSQNASRKPNIVLLHEEIHKRHITVFICPKHWQTPNNLICFCCPNELQQGKKKRSDDGKKFL